MEETKTGEGAAGSNSAEGELASLRTYKHDVADSLRGGDASSVSVAVQDEIRKEKVEVAVRKELNASKLFVLGIALLVGLGAIALAYVFFIHEPPAAIIPTPIEDLPSPLLQVEARTRLDVGNLSENELYREVAGRVIGAGLKSDTLEELIPVRSAGASSTPTLISAEEFIVRLGLKAPPRLLRFIDKRFLFGVYAFRETRAFVILKPTSFGPVFAELLAWEETMPADLYPLLSGKNLPSDLNASWRDEVIKNIDVRTYKNTAGEYMLIYGFLPSKDTLVIASGLDTFTEVLLRSQSPKPVEK